MAANLASPISSVQSLIPVQEPHHERRQHGREVLGHGSETVCP
jgi:hypothetical protein